MNITHDNDDRRELEKLCYTRMQLDEALRCVKELIKQKQWEQSKKS